MTSPRVLILAGGLSHEREVSIRSGRRVAEALRTAGVDVTIRDVDADLLPALDSDRPDVVWPLVHGSTGEDGSIRDVLELAGVRYVGTGPRASRSAWNKPVAKSVVAQSGITTPDYVTLPQSLFRELGAQPVLDSVVSQLGLPLVVKPAEGGSSLGVSLVTDRSELSRAMVTCFSYGPTALIEQAVAGTELAVSIVETAEGIVALPPVEIVTDGPYDFDARYNPGRTQYFAPARLTPAEADAVTSCALMAHAALGLAHISRTDMIMTPSGSVEFLEVNVAPGMTETSLLPQAVVASNRSLPELYRAIVSVGAQTSRRREAPTNSEVGR